MNNKIDKDLNIAGKLSLAFINHPLTFIFGVFILALGYISLIVMPREENPQIKVSGGVVIVALPGALPSEIQKVIIEPLEKKIKDLNISYSTQEIQKAIIQANVMELTLKGQTFYIKEKTSTQYDDIAKALGIMPLKTYTTKTDILKHFRHRIP